jgi:hypothetical protein
LQPPDFRVISWTNSSAALLEPPLTNAPESFKLRKSAALGCAEFRRLADTRPPPPHKTIRFYGDLSPKVRGLPFAPCAAWVILKVIFNFAQKSEPQKRI